MSSLPWPTSKDAMNKRQTTYASSISARTYLSCGETRLIHTVSRQRNVKHGRQGPDKRPDTTLNHKLHFNLFSRVPHNDHFYATVIVCSEENIVIKYGNHHNFQYYQRPLMPNCLQRPHGCCLYSMLQQWSLRSKYCCRKFLLHRQGRAHGAF